MNVERLLKVVEAVRNAPPEKFSLRHWDCGTTACAVGWYCRANPEADLIVFRSWPWSRSMDTPSISMQFLMSWGIVMEHFGLTSDQTLCLFSVEEYHNLPDRQAVIDRIEAMVAEHRQQSPDPIPSMDVKLPVPVRETMAE